MSVSITEESAPAKTSSSSHRLFATLSLTALISTIILIMIGSIVRVTGFGLGCPDWPLCHGQAIPPFLASAWVEFTHRLFGAVVVLQAGALVIMSWRWYRHDKWIFRTAVAGTFVLAIQVVLGGIHVIYELPRWTGWIHTGVAMLVAGVIAVWVAVTRPSLRRLGRRTADAFKGSNLPRWSMVGALATYVLLMTGSLVTRTGASLVCPSFPNCGLAIIPTYLRPIVTIQMVHRFAAFAVAITIIVILWKLLRASRHDKGISRLAWALLGLLALQIALGITNVLFALPMWSRVLHLGTGATIWVLMVILSVVMTRGENQTIVSSLGEV